MNDLFKNKGITTSGILHLTPREAFELCQQGAILFDVREDFMGHFKTFDVKDLFFCPRSILEENYLEIPRDKPLIFADAVGLRSKEAVLFLMGKGYELIANMAGGLVEWERDGLPVKVDKSENLTGSCMCMLRKRTKK
ncbi:MAG: rhodanese-like domain-containing protein [Bacteroidales bacterium]|jgi:rhodanese-related sulfurtransferase